MKLRRGWVLISLIGVSLTALGEEMSTTITQTTGDKTAATGNTVTTTQITQDDQALVGAVQNVLREGAYTGITATVSAGNVTLRGSVMEDKLQPLVDSISRLDKVGAVNIDGVVTTRQMPSIPNMPIDKPSPAAGLIAPPSAGSAAQ